MRIRPRWWIRLDWNLIGFCSPPTKQTGIAPRAAFREKGGQKKNVDGDLGEKWKTDGDSSARKKTNGSSVRKNTALLKGRRPPSWSANPSVFQLFILLNNLFFYFQRVADIKTVSMSWVHDKPYERIFTKNPLKILFKVELNYICK